MHASVQNEVTARPGSPGQPPAAAPATAPAVPELRYSLGDCAGMRIVPLHRCSAAVLESGATCYALAQLNGPIPRSYGFTAGQLQEYARFLVAEAAKHPWNLGALDEQGQIQALVLLMPHIERLDAAGLPSLAQRHWREVFLAIERVFRQRAGAREADRALAAVFLGTAPRFQGNGLAGHMSRHCGKVARAHGYETYWTFTANPTLVRSVGSAEERLSPAKRAIDAAFRLPSTCAANRLAIPVLKRVGGIPKDWGCFFVSGKDVPGIQAVKSLALVTNAPLPGARHAAATSKL